jgi:CMP-N,N'-diacetyllegionaminic acid synthase
MRVLGLIPARGGSKGVPRKNIRDLCGKPLLEYTADAARASKLLARVVLSTDDEEIAGVGRKCGLDVPFMRPAELAQDAAPSLHVVKHALEWLAGHGEVFEAVCLLQPTHPFRQAGDIDDCIRLLEETGADSVVTVLPVPPEHNPHWVFFREADGRLRLSTGESRLISRRQDLPPAFHREGSVYVTRRDVVLNGESLLGERVIGYPIDPGRSVNIDTPEDWVRAENLMRERTK